MNPSPFTVTPDGRLKHDTTFQSEVAKLVAEHDCQSVLNKGIVRIKRLAISYPLPIESIAIAAIDSHSPHAHALFAALNDDKHWLLSAITELTYLVCGVASRTPLITALNSVGEQKTATLLATTFFPVLVVANKSSATYNFNDVA